MEKYSNNIERYCWITSQKGRYNKINKKDAAYLL